MTCTQCNTMSSKLVHVLVVSVAGFVTYVANPGSSLFSWHPTLMILSFGFLMIEGILAFSNSSLLPSSWSGPAKKDFHIYIEFVSDLMLLAGFLVIYYNKEFNGKPHFVSWHGVIGLAAVLFCICTHFTGVLVKYNKYLRSFLKPSNIKIFHVSVALFTFTLGSLSIVTGMQSNWFTDALPTWTKAACVAAAVFTGVLIGLYIVRVWQRRWSKMK